MNQRSNIGATLSKKRKMGFFKKIGIYLIFILFLFSLGIWGLTTSRVQIKEVKISGNSSISSIDILETASTEINKYYLFIIPTNNILLLRRNEIKNKILDDFKKIASVSIYLNSFDKIEIAVIERESNNLWCKNVVGSSKTCYFMDSGGFIFQEAPKFSENIFPEYFGLITEENPIGQFYFKDNFSSSGGKNISNLFSTLKEMSFKPSFFNAINEHEYEICILGGGKILINDKRDFESSLLNLQALIDNGYIKNDPEFLKKIKYIDLRFGNKVNFELLK